MITEKAFFLIQWQMFLGKQILFSQSCRLSIQTTPVKIGK